ncbi:hypothetical protein [Saccharothrix texasensis]|uniref:hypothetical protein n=1 Tax=Saccharothrix texasensis TaxID=103734 RepID=UPI000F4C48E0|nr:hypothetical protein [Saccharothrix texasensis]
MRDNVRNEGHHDVVVHGSSDGWPIRPLACHSGNDVGWAQHVADRLGVPVMAPVDAVGVARRPDSVARVRGHEPGAGRRWFLPNHSGS